MTDAYIKRLDEQNRILKHGVAAINENLTSIAKSLQQINRKLGPLEDVEIVKYWNNDEKEYVTGSLEDDGK